jgi:hypothetical protein
MALVADSKISRVIQGLEGVGEVEISRLFSQEGSHTR